VPTQAPPKQASQLDGECSHDNKHMPAQYPTKPEGGVDLDLTAYKTKKKIAMRVLDINHHH